jgi:hypothetical protein
VHPALESRDHISSVFPVLGADHYRVHRLEQPPRVLEETNTELVGRLPAARSVIVRNPDEVGGIEGRKHARVRRGVDVGEANDADSHARSPNVTGLPVTTDSVAASPILSAS